MTSYSARLPTTYALSDPVSLDEHPRSQHPLHACPHRADPCCSQFSTSTPCTSLRTWKSTSRRSNYCVRPYLDFKIGQLPYGTERLEMITKLCIRFVQLAQIYLAICKAWHDLTRHRFWIGLAATIDADAKSGLTPAHDVGQTSCLGRLERLRNWGDGH